MRTSGIFSGTLGGLGLDPGGYGCEPRRHIGRGPDAATMRAALHTTPDEEQGFIDRVLLLVEQNKLPADMVRSTFLWARRKTRHQFQYFKYALTVRASDFGVQLQ